MSDPHARNARAVERHRRAEQQLTLLTEAASNLTSSLEPGAVLSAILSLARRLIAADAYAVWRQEAASGRWTIVSADGLSEAYLRLAGQVTAPAGRLGDTPVIAEDVQQTPLLEERRRLYQQEAIRSLLAVPLRIHGEVSGTLVFYFREKHPFPPGEVRVATALAYLAASAIGTAELYEQESRQRVEAEAARKRLAFLAEAGSVLGSSLDFPTTLEQVARLAVPRFADLCVVYHLAEDGSIRHLSVAHAERAREELVRELSRRYPLDPDFPRGFRRVLRTGRPDLIEEVSETLLQAAAHNAEHLQLLRQLRLVSNLCVPLVARGRVLGALTFATAESGRRYGPADLAVAEELARRAAVAIDNALLYREVREADRRKDEFLAQLGHALRNPLAPIRGGLEVLRLQAEGDPVVGRVCELMERQVAHLTRLADDLQRRREGLATGHPEDTDQDRPA